MFIFAAAVQGAATRYRGGETGGVGGGGGVLQARGLWPRACKTKGAGACHLAGPRPFVRALRARRPPHVPPKPRPPLPEGRLHPSLALLRTGLVGRLRCAGGAAGGAQRPCRAGAKGPRPARLAAGGRQTPPPPPPTPGSNRRQIEKPTPFKGR